MELRRKIGILRDRGLDGEDQIAALVCDGGDYAGQFGLGQRF
jgi:hypothetical protein